MNCIMTHEKQIRVLSEFEHKSSPSNVLQWSGKKEMTSGIIFTFKQKNLAIGELHIVELQPFLVSFIQNN